MKTPRPSWILGLCGILLVIAAPVIFFWPRDAVAADSPWRHLPVHVVHVDHKDIVRGPFETPQQVTTACLQCHPEAAPQVMRTTHWTWESEPVSVPGHDQPVTIGKKNQINNFCIGIQGNWNKCTTCHVGYGWADANFDFSNQSNVDCLACHADPALYSKGQLGLPTSDTDLLAAAQSVRAPTRQNCGKCHFTGGGGNGVKHGDLDESLYFPSAELDVHMGGNDLQCTDCHQTTDHQIRGRAISVTMSPENQVECTDCHDADPHADERISLHLTSVDCRTCHIPAIALEDPTKVTWDWSTAGQDHPDDHFTYLKIKGSFVYDKNLRPTYLWFNGNLSDRYLLGDPIDPSRPTVINQPAGSIADPTARITPFKLHIARQPYDKVFSYLLQPRTAGPGGFWTTFDWPSALALGAQDTNLQFSGQYGFTETWMYWQTSHMVQPAAQALQCEACHGEQGRLDWQALGYPGDPIQWGGRFDPR
jgi:octaheme c-type cytochrome (tetrathionate reductase family)